MNFLITGANGFIGQNLLKLLSNKGEKVIAVVRNEKSNIENIKNIPNVTIVFCELSEIKKLSKLVNDTEIDCCIHLAWEGSGGKARADSKIQLQNVQNTLELCKTLSEMRVDRFVGIGTVKEKEIINFITEDGTTTSPLQFYGTAKISAHYMSKIICSELGVQHLWCQLSNIYGEGDETNNFINYACKLMLSGQRASFTAGEQIVDFTYISDIVDGIYNAAKYGKCDTEYYIGSGEPRKLKEYLCLIKNSINPDIDLHLGEIPYKGAFHNSKDFDYSKLFKDTGYCAKISFEKGIKKTIAWLKTLGY